MTAEQVINEVRDLTHKVLGGCDADVYLFGSWAIGTPSQTSDIDLGIDPRKPLAPGTLAILRERFEDSHIPYRVDVVDLTAVDAAFRATVMREGIRWND